MQIDWLQHHNHAVNRWTFIFFHLDPVASFAIWLSFEYINDEHWHGYTKWLIFISPSFFLSFLWSEKTGFLSNSWHHFFFYLLRTKNKIPFAFASIGEIAQFVDYQFVYFSCVCLGVLSSHRGTNLRFSILFYIPRKFLSNGSCSSPQKCFFLSNQQKKNSFIDDLFSSFMCKIEADNSFAIANIQIFKWRISQQKKKKNMETCSMHSFFR